jgi:ArsR family metal-binding transcriptional regulator
MDRHVIKEEGYSFFLVNIDCLPNSDHFNVIMELEESAEELLPYLAAELPGCTYVHGSGVLNLMDEGHIVAIYPRKITITDLTSVQEAEEICREYFQKIRGIKDRKNTIAPVFHKRSSITVLDIFRSLPRTNCGLCNCPTCMAFAAKVFQRGDLIASCDPLRSEREKYRKLLHQLRTNGYQTP